MGYNETEWIRHQGELSAQVTQQDDVRWVLPGQDGANKDGVELQFVGGLDVSFASDEPNGEDPQHAVACLTVLDLQSLTVVYQDFEPVDLTIPYKSGFLAFREVTPYKALLTRAQSPRPQIVIVDGFGVLHHRRCGSASHLGVEMGVPTIGVGKKLLRVDGLEEWLVLQDLRAALMRERGDDLRIESLSIAEDGPPPSCSWSADARDPPMPMTSSVLVPAFSRGGSSSTVSAHQNRFNWQNVSEGNAPAPSTAASGEFNSMAISMAIADSGPVFEPTIGGAGPMGERTTSGPAFGPGAGGDGLQGIARGPSTGAEIFMPGAETSDTEDTGTLVKRTDGGSAQAYYTRRGRDGVSVVCSDLVSNVDSERLGVALAGVAGTLKPIYVSVGHKVSLDTAVAVVLACCQHRIPEPVRQADLRSRQHIRTEKAAAAMGACETATMG